MVRGENAWGKKRKLVQANLVIEKRIDKPGWGAKVPC